MLNKRLGLPIMLDRVTEDRSGEQSSRPLVGIRVLELGRVLAGPFCGMLLADLGAEVIKVEPPHGDDARTFGPFVDGASTYYRLLNRDKLGISLDLKQSDQLAVLQRLIERSDVLIENFRPETLERLGLPVARIRELNPRLVVVSITGFGHSGPLRDLPAYDLLIQAMSGLMAATGPVDGDPTRSAVSLGDLVPGLYGALGALAGLYEQQRTGVGRHVDVAMLDGLVSLLESVAKRALHRNELRAEIEAELAVLTSEQALARLRQAEIPVGPILGVREALAQPQALARAMVVEEEDGFRTIGSALKLGDPPRAPRPAPLFGEHQELIEGWLAEPPR